MVIIRTVLFEPCKGVMQLLPILSYVQHYKKYHAARFEAASVQYGLNQLEIDILLFLHNNPDCRTASDICRYRGLAKSNVSAAVERLRARGVLTVLADIQRCSLEPLFAGFTAQEQQTLQDYLRRMDANLLRELNKE